MKEQFYDYRLDNAGKLYPPLLSKERTTIFRIAALMDKPVRIGALEEAARNMMARCPYYQVTLKQGVFWYYLDKVDTLPLVHGESQSPCQYIPFKRRDVLPFRIIAYRHRIAFEASHLLADGKSAVMFLNGLILEYLKIMGEDVSSDGMVLDCEDDCDPEEYSDGYKRNFDRNIPRAKPCRRAAQLRGAPLKPPRYRIIEGILITGDVKIRAEAFGVTIGVYLSAVLLKVLCDLERTKKRMKPVTVTIPVDVRQFFPSKTMRNFMLTVEPTVDPRLGRTTLEYIIGRVRDYMRLEMDINYLKMQIARNIRGEANVLSRVLPLLLKKPILKWINRRMGENTYTMSFSNLGLVRLPVKMGKYVKKYEIIPPRNSGRINLTAIGYRDSISLFFGSTLWGKEVEAAFFAALRKEGVSVSIMTNLLNSGRM